jgi:ribosomal protein L11 methyltransferase
MKTTGVSQVTIHTSLLGEEPVGALLERVYGEPATAYANLENQTAQVSVFVRATPGQLKTQLPEIKEGLEAIRECGVDLGESRVEVARVRREDWSESWKKYFKTIEVGRSLLIKPSWSKQRPKPGQATVVLDPGLSFGTGQHATTSFCLRELTRHRKRLKEAALMDAGCGSGILAIAAAKLGYTPVEAFDFDPVAVRIARKNCEINRVEKKVAVSRKDLTRLSLRPREKFEVICANLMAPLLLAERDRLLARLAPGGILILAGILATEFSEVQKRYEEAGLRLLRTKAEREWQSGSFMRPGK